MIERTNIRSTVTVDKLTREDRHGPTESFILPTAMGEVNVVVQALPDGKFCAALRHIPTNAQANITAQARVLGP